MKSVIVIPARFASTRFPGKPLVSLGGKPIIQHVYEAVQGLEIPVFVATDNETIFETVEKFGGKAIMTSSKHKSGSDRIAEVIENMDCDIVINVQGDEPFIKIEPLKKLIESLESGEYQVASLMTEIKEKEELNDSNNVKVVLTNDDSAIYFSRYPIPFNRDEVTNVTYWKHIGVYAYTKKALLDFVKLPQSNLENIEKLEQLRFLENGYKIKMINTQYKGIGIDTPQDLQEAEWLLNNLK